MEDTASTAKSWRSTQVYGLAVVCLLSGAIIGYLARAPFQSNTVKSRVAGPTVADASNAKIASNPLKQGGDKQVEPLLDQLRKSPDDPSLLAELGKVYYQRGQFRMAAEYYEDSVRIKPDAVVLVKLGGAYHNDGDEDKAIGAWNHALRLDPGNPDALFNIGFVKWKAQGDRKAAIAAWQKLLKTNPNHPKRAQVEALLAQAKQHPEAPMARKE
jgi:cytochrome c-type biogenesis protein CcmH/NrfG